MICLQNASSLLGGLQLLNRATINIDFLQAVTLRRTRWELKAIEFAIEDHEFIHEALSSKIRPATLSQVIVRESIEPRVRALEAKLA